MEFEKLRYTVKVSAEGKAAGPLDKLKGRRATGTSCTTYRAA